MQTLPEFAPSIKELNDNCDTEWRKALRGRCIHKPNKLTNHHETTSITPKASGDKR